ncbi:hypothetical protein [Lentzea flava]|uniref:Uncharacterized protein n=1 Tax=Lentzea flava TaxID=103732 RepID=A0ABQ2US90_9PSEU|nr:hypothetical protein [Lentzea flava]GGU50981.1 hypothetical protein GCM10010178_49710 [Lentzea flava]
MPDPVLGAPTGDTGRSNGHLATELPPTTATPLLTSVPESFHAKVDEILLVGTPSR